MLKRTTRLMTAAVAAAALTFAAIPATAAEAKTDIMPALTGEGAGQTYAQAVWVMVIFIILLAVLYPTAWKNVVAGLKKREEKIRADIADAEAARRKGEATLKEYNVQLAKAESQVRELLNNATAEAEKIAASIKLRAQEETEEIRERATKEIEAAHKAAMTEVYEQTANLATMIAEKILKRNLNADDQKALVSESLDKLQQVG
jgi:F-type H+-transporting ATPase subunit b